MNLKVGDVVRYTSTHHSLDENEFGRICKPFGKTFFWVNFAVLGCVLVKNTSLQKVAKNAPSCDGCPS